LLNIKEVLEIADKKRRFFYHSVILKGLMRGPQKVKDFLGCPAPRRCPEQSEGTHSDYRKKGGDSSLTLRMTTFEGASSVANAPSDVVLSEAKE